LSIDLLGTADRARAFRSLHHAEKMLLLPNAWDVITARLFEDSGFAAVGTTSFGIARAHGFRDGDNAAYEVTLSMVQRMARALTVPLNADVEAGYGDTARAVAERAAELIRAGVVGFNIEDGQAHADSPLADLSLQCEKIAALKEAGSAAGVPAFVNARTDVYWLGVGAGSTALDEALRRAQAYAGAGADGIFIPGLVAPRAIASAVQAISVPLNILASPATPPAAHLAELGVKRLSLGSGPVRATLGLLRRIASEVIDQGTYAFLASAVPYDEANGL
jgi:2-methylisocitrate lyase-like PEP mutase family enzyme